MFEMLIELWIFGGLNRTGMQMEIWRFSALFWGYTSVSQFYQQQIINQNQMKENQITQEEIPMLFQKHFPAYKASQVKLTRLLGMTNKTYKVQFPGQQSFIMRIFYADKDHSLDNKIYSQLSSMKVAPKCHYYCERYRIEAFLENAKHPPLDDLLNKQEVTEKIVKEIFKFHELDIEEIRDKQVFADTVLTDETVKKLNELETKDKETFHHFQEFKVKLQSIYENMEQLKNQLLIDNKSTVKLCHNDLNQLNIMVKDEGTENEETVLIDYDYISYNYVAYDLANFLNEMCFFYYGEQPGFKVIHKITYEEIHRICSFYEGSYQGLERDILKMLALCNLYWALWSLESSINAVLSTFKVLVHGQARLELFHYYYEKLQENQ